MKDNSVNMLLIHASMQDSYVDIRQIHFNMLHVAALLISNTDVNKSRVNIFILHVDINRSHLSIITSFAR